MRSVVFCFWASVMYALSWCFAFHGHFAWAVVLSVIATILEGVAVVLASSFEDRVKKLEKEIKELRERKE